MHSAQPAAGLEPATFRRLFALAWPIVISRSSQTVIGLSDAILCAPLGESSLAAATAGGMNAFTLFILPMGMVFVVASFSSQYTGKGDSAGARRYGMYGLWLALLAEVFCLLGAYLAPMALQHLEFTPEVRTLMSGYLRYRLLSGGAVVGMEALAGYYGGLGNTRLPMIANVVAMVLNVLLNWILIWGHFGAPAMGVNGAALASTLATTTAFGGLLFCYWRGLGTSGAWIKGAVQPVAGADLPRQRLSLSEFGNMVKIGLPSGLNWFFEFAAFMFFINVVVPVLGTTAVAALMAVFQINGVSFMPAFGLASAGAILVGQEIGANERDRVPKTVRLTFLAALAWQGIAGLIYLALPNLLMRPFASGDDTVSANFYFIGSRMLMISAAWQAFDAVCGTLTEALRAAGDTAFTLWIRLGVAWLFFVPGVWFTVVRNHQDDRAAMGWLVAYLAVLGGALYLRFRSGAWRKIEITQPV
ncbi:MAG: MATE family efflux transporter [Deltaproteobacteria bacterium]|nr:MATE family efflux transporter [Deltaproteobacteria bacterium]